MDPAPMSLDESLAELSAATGRLLASAAKLTDASIVGPSRLPGWTRGHVISHLARNASGIGNLIEGLLTGADLAMYTSAESRNTDIEIGALRSADEQVADLRASAQALNSALASLPEASLGATILFGAARVPVPAWEAPLLRIREVQIHHVDLAVGFAPDDWPNRFAVRTLDQLAPFFAENRQMPIGRLVDPERGAAWTVAAAGPDLVGPAGLLAAWLTGRSAGPDLLVSDGSAVPTCPPWV